MPESLGPSPKETNGSLESRSFATIASDYPVLKPALWQMERLTEERHKPESERAKLRGLAEGFAFRLRQAIKGELKPEEPVLIMFIDNTYSRIGREEEEKIDYILLESLGVNPGAVFGERRDRIKRIQKGVPGTFLDQIGKRDTKRLPEGIGEIIYGTDVAGLSFKIRYSVGGIGLQSRGEFYYSPQDQGRKPEPGRIVRRI